MRRGNAISQVVLNSVGAAQKALGNNADALKSFRDGLAIMERLVKNDPRNPGWQRDLAVSHSKIAEVQRAQGDLSAAVISYQASLAIRERLAKSNPDNIGWQQDLAATSRELGNVQMAQGDPAAALTSYQTYRDTADRIAQSNSENLGWQRDLAVSYQCIGDAELALGDLSAAEAAYRSQLALMERVAKADPGPCEPARRRFDLLLAARRRATEGRPSGRRLWRLPGGGCSHRHATPIRSRRRRFAAPLDHQLPSTGSGAGERGPGAGSTRPFQCGN